MTAKHVYQSLASSRCSSDRGHSVIVGGRIEDMIRVTAAGAEPLTRFSLEPLIIA